MPTVEFNVTGEPKGQPRPKFARRGSFVQTYDPGTANDWKNRVAFAGQGHKPADPIEAPVTLRLVFYMPRPKRLDKANPGPIPHTVKPDIDNMVKAVMDCLTDAGWWKDDALVTCAVAAKFYASLGWEPGATVRLEWDEKGGGK